MLVFIATRSCCKETRNIKAEQCSQDFTIPVIGVHEFVTKENDKFFFPNQGERDEHVGGKGSGSGPASKGKKKPVSGDKGINIVAM